MRSWEISIEWNRRSSYLECNFFRQVVYNSTKIYLIKNTCIKNRYIWLQTVISISSESEILGILRTMKFGDSTRCWRFEKNQSQYNNLIEADFLVVIKKIAPKFTKWADKAFVHISKVIQDLHMTLGFLLHIFREFRNYYSLALWDLNSLLW